MCGIGAEIAQTINELAFDELDAPVGRLHPFATSHPFAPVLERAMLVDTARIVDGARAGARPASRRCRTTGARRALAAAAAPVAAAPRRRLAAAKPPATKPPVAAGELEITMPFGDLTVSEGRLVAWRKAVGDAVAAGELVAEIETDKAVVEIESPGAGTLSAIEEQVGAVVPMGGRIGRVRTG